MQVFNTIGNVSSVSSVYRILKSELKLRSYIYSIQRQDHFFENQQVMVNALSVLTFVIAVTLMTYTSGQKKGYIIVYHISLWHTGI